MNYFRRVLQGGSNIDERLKMVTLFIMCVLIIVCSRGGYASDMGDYGPFQLGAKRSAVNSHIEELKKQNIVVNRKGNPSHDMYWTDVTLKTGTETAGCRLEYISGRLYSIQVAYQTFYPPHEIQTRLQQDANAKVLYIASRYGKPVKLSAIPQLSELKKSLRSPSGFVTFEFAQWDLPGKRVTAKMEEISSTQYRISILYIDKKLLDEKKQNQEDHKAFIYSVHFLVALGDEGLTEYWMDESSLRDITEPGGEKTVSVVNIVAFTPEGIRVHREKLKKEGKRPEIYSEVKKVHVTYEFREGMYRGVSIAYYSANKLLGTEMRQNAEWKKSTPDDFTDIIGKASLKHPKVNP